MLNLNLTHEEAAIIGHALANMPYRQVAQLMQKIETQIRAQVSENTASDRMVAAQVESKT